MMTNLFSMFDPSNFMMKTTWIIPSISIMCPLLVNDNKFNSTFKKMSLMLSMEFSILTSSKISNSILIPMFSSILMLNVISLIPNSFAMTAQISTIIPISLPLWMMSMTYYLSKNTNKLMTHMLPSNTPIPLMPMMVMIELISNLIRPITLSVRLVANITAGHLLMHLMSSFSCSMYPSVQFMFSMMISVTLNVLEIGVAFIQSYIMCTLIALYSSEIK